MEQIKIAFDIHGVLSQNQRYNLSSFLKTIYLTSYDNIRFHVISGAPVIDMMKQLKQKYDYNLNMFDGCHSITQRLFKNGNYESCLVDAYGMWNFLPQELWWSAKNQICLENDIKFLVDDKQKYNVGVFKTKDYHFINSVDFFKQCLQMPFNFKKLINFKNVNNVNCYKKQEMS